MYSCFTKKAQTIENSCCSNCAYFDCELGECSLGISNANYCDCFIPLEKDNGEVYYEINADSNTGYGY